MNYLEFRRHLGKAGLSVDRFARLMHVRASSVSNYARKEHVPQFYSVVAVLLGDAADKGTDFRSLLASFGVRERSADAKLTDLVSYRKTRSKGK